MIFCATQNLDEIRAYRARSCSVARFPIALADLTFAFGNRPIEYFQARNFHCCLFDQCYTWVAVGKISFLRYILKMQENSLSIAHRLLSLWRRSFYIFDFLDLGIFASCPSTGRRADGILGHAFYSARPAFGRVGSRSFVCVRFLRIFQQLQQSPRSHSDNSIALFHQWRFLLHAKPQAAFQTFGPLNRLLTT